MVMVSRKVSALKVLYWNARSVQNKVLDFFDYLVDHDIDVALLQETLLKPNHALSHKDFKCYRLDRLDTTGGGVAAVVKKSICHSLMPSLNAKVILE